MALEAAQLLRNSLAPASWRAYGIGEMTYRRFCGRYGLRPVPATSDTLMYYMADLRRAGVACSTVRQRLAAVRHLHIRCGFNFAAGDAPVVRAAARGYAVRGGSAFRPVRRGITVTQLRVLKTSLGDRGLSYFFQPSL